MLKPRNPIDPTQEQYQTREWQKNERDVDREVEQGKLSSEFKKKEEGLK